MREVVIAAGLLAAASGAQASTPAAWDAMHQRANRACVAMSGLAYPKLLAKKISFSDTIGVEIRQITGNDRRGRMQRLLCAYNRSTGRAEIQSADVWNGPATRP